MNINREASIHILGLYSEKTQRDFLRMVLRGRRKWYYFGICKREEIAFLRNDIRDYLKKKFPDVRMTKNE